MLYYTILTYTILTYTILTYTILCYTLLCPTILYNREQTLSQAETPGNKSATNSKVKKPPTPEMLEKIIKGKVQKRLAEICLLSQVCRYVHSGS